jgi:hypothetical protein
VVDILEFNIFEELFPLELFKNVINPRIWVLVPNYDFFLKLCNQCRVTKSCPYSAPIQSPFHKGRSWVCCAPFEEVLVFDA